MTTRIPGSARWGGNGLNPVVNAGLDRYSNPWRERDLWMLVRVCEALEQEQRRCYASPTKRRINHGWRKSAAGILAHVQRGGDSLTGIMRARVERWCEVLGIEAPPPVTETRIYEVADGFVKPLKPPPRAVREEED